MSVVPHPTELDPATAARWIGRWERQQERYATDREERFTAIADVVESATAGRDRPRIADLGSGPGSLAARIATRLPDARIVAADTDPLLLALGRAHHGDTVRFVQTLIGAPGWVAALGADGPLDAVVSTTALHYPTPDTLATIYRDLATALRPGGVFVNGDHFLPDEPDLADLARALGRRDGATEEDWTAWWAAAEAEPSFQQCWQPARSGWHPPTGTATACRPPGTNCCSGRRVSVRSPCSGSTAPAASRSPCADRGLTSKGP